LRDVLKDRAEKLKNGNPDRTKPMRLLELLADPVDPVQTVENFFDLSFLVKVRLNLSTYLLIYLCLEISN